MKSSSSTKSREKAVSASSQKNQPDPNEAHQEPDSIQQPAWHVAVLGAFTCNIAYLVFWAYRTWRDLKREAGKLPADSTSPLTAFANINPLMRALALCIPVVNIYLLATLVVAVAQLDPNANAFQRRRPLLAAGLVIAAYLGFASLARLPGEWYFLSLLGSVPFAFVQHWLNKYWRSVETDALFIRHAFNVWEMLVIIVGASLLGLSAAGTMMGIKP